MIGHGWQRAGKPITARDVERELHRLSHQLQALDLIATDRAAVVGWAIGALTAAGSGPARRPAVTLTGGPARGAARDT